MKLLCTADLHYRLPQFDWLVEQAADVDVVVISKYPQRLSAAQASLSAQQTAFECRTAS